MASVNKVIVLGNLGKDPEVRYTPSGSAVCNISVATTRSWKARDSNERQEETEWHRVVFYDRLAEVAGEYLKKGRPVYVEGRLKTRKWQDKEGRDIYTTEIIAESMQLLGGRDDGDGGTQRGGEGGGRTEDRGQRGGQDRANGSSRDQARGSYDRGSSGGGGQRSQGGSNGAGRPQQRSSGFDDMDDDIPF